jgi:predicted ester cyclase
VVARPIFPARLAKIIEKALIAGPELNFLMIVQCQCISITLLDDAFHISIFKGCEILSKMDQQSGRKFQPRREVFKQMGVTVPDLRWIIEDIQIFGDQIVVRGRATGTPIKEFWGAPPTGKSFDTMAIDIFTVRNGKLATAYHIENWMTALQQIK